MHSQQWRMPIEVVSTLQTKIASFISHWDYRDFERWCLSVPRLHTLYRQANQGDLYTVGWLHLLKTITIRQNTLDEVVPSVSYWPRFATVAGIKNAGKIHIRPLTINSIHERRKKHRTSCLRCQILYVKNSWAIVATAIYTKLGHWIDVTYIYPLKK